MSINRILNKSRGNIDFLVGRRAYLIDKAKWDYRSKSCKRVELLDNHRLAQSRQALDTPTPTRTLVDTTRLEQSPI